MNLDSDHRVRSEPVVPKSLKLAIILLVVLAIVGGALKLWRHGLGTADSSAPGTPWEASPAYLERFSDLKKYGRVGPVRIVDSKYPALAMLSFSPSVHPDSMLCKMADNLGPNGFSSFDDPYPSNMKGTLEGLHATHPNYF